jgi:hypothetical protein
MNIKIVFQSRSEAMKIIALKNLKTTKGPCFTTWPFNIL